MHICFVVFVFVFQYLAKRLVGKVFSEMAYFVLGAWVGRKTLTQSLVSELL